ncbi:hypothetical protein CDL12_14122 [Handroanthus impetiginosus]|uniref:Neprosin PEP catalytic domain-containing protein n=1 Tax=Handroanthus impetiginosus TaxID=429701 RepID=A0A2G9H6U6_9LAMI|nr:hypothetical protein CDL12_14122 [Handroanthus impetiginosus]
MKPSYEVKMEGEDGKKMDMGRNRESSVTITTQIWHKSGSCPKGTIPIRRIQKNNTNYGRKEPLMFMHSHKEFNGSKALYLQQKNHSLAILHEEGFAYFGGKADIKVWNPNVERDDEYSTSRVALKSGPYYDYEAVESGWAVNPKIYADRQTRLYVYWTVDGSQKTGCFDLTCPGFVQTSNEIALGAAIYPISNPTGLPYQITIYIHKDPNTNNLWVTYGDKVNIGYFPQDLFVLLRYHATTVQWGGEVYSSRVGDTHPHTSTHMGNGNFPDFIMGNSGLIKRMRILGNNMVLRFPKWVYAMTEEYNCYRVYYATDYVEEPEFYYGGPGRSPVCP